MIEILIVLAIVLFASLIAIPVLSTLDGRQVTDGTRIFTGSLVGIRDSAIRYNQPRGIRLLPDPTLTIPAPGQPGAGTIQLCYRSMIPIEPAGDYSQGKVTIGPQYYFGGTPDTTKFPPFYTAPDGGVYQYPFYESPGISKVLMIEESPYANGFLLNPLAPGVPNSPTNWYWTVRVGDKIKLFGTGRAYTIVGPCTINPYATTASGNQGNPEMFVNIGAPGTQSPLKRTYYAPDATKTPPVAQYGTALYPEFLFLVNSENDTDTGYGHTGYADEGFDGLNNNPFPPPVPKPGDPVEYSDAAIDDLTEWETEKWGGASAADTLADLPFNVPLGSPSGDWVVANFGKGTQDVSYIIERRPVPSPGAREVSLPAGIVIDATTWNTTRERSRIPVQAGSLYCDVMVNPSGVYIPTTQYSTPASADPLPFLHFWICQRSEVFPRGSIWGVNGTGVPNLNPSSTASKLFYELPMTADTPGYPPTAAATAPVLKGDRRLATMFNQSGLVVTNTVETIAAPNVTTPGEGFNVLDINWPYLKAQQGLRESR